MVWVSRRKTGMEFPLQDFYSGVFLGSTPVEEEKQDWVDEEVED